MGIKLTKEDIKKIEEEIDYRTNELQPKLLDELREARAQGDLSENFEYAMSKRANRQNRSRISYLEGIVRNATVIEDDASEDEAGLNKRVTIFTEDEQKEETYKIVSSIRSNSLENRISPESPLGKALMHHKVGDRVEVVVNERFSYFAVIRKIEAVEDDGSDPLRQY